MNNPLANLPETQTMTVLVNQETSLNQFLPENYSKAFGVAKGADSSPSLSWSDAPDSAKSFLISMYDPDAPTESGFWHWVLKDVPAHVTSLPSGLLTLDAGDLPAGSQSVSNDARVKGYIGAAPAPGETHRYHLMVTALDVERLDIPDDATPAFMEFNALPHIVARGLAVVEGKI